MRRIPLIALFLGAVAALLSSTVVPAFAAAPTGSTTATYSTYATSTASKVSTATGYEMSLTLPTYGKSGCMVCHGDPNLVRIKAGRLVSYAMDQKKIDSAAHSKISCTGCHTDFAYSAPHKTSSSWREAAKGSCRACHTKEWDALSASVHGGSKAPGQKSTGKKPLCGDCHGGHYIGLASKDPAARTKLHASANAMCGRCHLDYWKNYDDYYHGAAYRKGASDAPACWQCHGSHDVLPTKDPESHTNPANLPETCSACHQGTSDAYTQYAAIIHRKDRVLAANPVYSVLRQTGDAITGAINSLVSQIQAMFASQPTKA
jgi:hypothetical protein